MTSDNRVASFSVDGGKIRMRQVAEEFEPESDAPKIEDLSLRRRHIYYQGQRYWNLARCRPPYEGTPILFSDDLMWIAQQEGWRVLTYSPEGGWPSGGDPPDLRGTVFKTIDLTGFDLSSAQLEDAVFTSGCRLDATNLVNADLRGARFEGVDLSRAILLDDTRIDALRRQLPGNPGDPPVGPLVSISTRNELLWILSHRYSPQLLDLSQADIYERDIKGLDLGSDNISSAQAFALVGSIARNLEEGNVPFEEITISSWKDLLWLKLALSEGKLNLNLDPKAVSNLRGANLSKGFRGATLYRVDLRKARLSDAVLDASDLSNARLDDAELGSSSVRGANLIHASLVHAKLQEAHLEGANLFEATLRYAHLDGAHLNGATLSVTDLRAATFRNANLECTDLRGARVNAATSFIDAQVNQGTQWGDVVFHSTPLLEINWRKAKILGDEAILRMYDFAKRTNIRNRYYRDVMRAYRQMYGKLSEQGFYGPARNYRLREKYLVRKQLLESFHPLKYFYSWIGFALIGYGEQPGKLLFPYFAVIGLWTTLYYALAHRMLGWLPVYQPDQLTVFQAAVLSISTFRGEPAFPPDLLQQHVIGKVLTVVGALETALGTIILLAMTLLWTRRLFGNETPVVDAGQPHWIGKTRVGVFRSRPSRRHAPAHPDQDQDTVNSP